MAEGVALALLTLLKELAGAALRWHWPTADAAPGPFAAWLRLSEALLLARASRAAARWSVWAIHRTSFLP